MCVSFFPHPFFLPLCFPIASSSDLFENQKIILIFNEWVLWSSIPTMGKISQRKKENNNNNKHNDDATNNWLRFLIHAFNLPSWSSCLFLLVFYFDELQHMTDWPINRYTGIDALETLDTFKLFDSNKSIYVYSRATERNRVLYLCIYIFTIDNFVSHSVGFFILV